MIMDYIALTIILMIVFLSIELMLGQIFLTDKSGYPSRTEDSVEYWFHIGIHSIIIMIITSSHYFG